jgi:tetratricopeptide (TPR) repeat protein
VEQYAEDQRKHMRNKFWISLVLVFVLVFAAAIPTMAESGGSDDNAVVYVAVGAAAAVIVAGVMIIHGIITNGKAAKAYNQGDAYAAQGKWDLAVAAYEEAAKIKPNYKDVQAKLANAKVQAAAMFIKLGDEAKALEKFEEAISLYQKALSYQPASTDAKAKIDELSKDMITFYYRQGRTYEVQRRWQEALNEYEKANRINPDYQDLSERINIAKAELSGNLPTRALLYLLNKSAEPGIENSMILALQDELVKLAPGKFVMLDQQKIRNIVDEQAAGLGANFDEVLAMDLGRLVGAKEVIVGEITSVSKSGRIKIELNAKILQVPDGKVVKEVRNFDFTFSNKVNTSNLSQSMPELAKELASKLK